MNEREYKKLNQVHNLIKDFEGDVSEALKDETDVDLRDVLRRPDRADEIVTELMHNYEERDSQ